MPFLAPIFGGIMAFRAVQNIVRLSKWYQRNKFAQTASSGPFGFMYAGGTVCWSFIRRLKYSLHPKCNPSNF